MNVYREEKKIHILQVTGSLRVGGLETVAVNLFRYCDKSKYAFDYLVYGNKIEPLETEIEKLGGKVFHIPYPHNNIIKYLKSMRTIMKKYGPYDVVHAHSLFNSGLVLMIAAQEKIPIRIAHGHSDRRNVKINYFRGFYNTWMRHLINKYATEKFACSEGAGKYLYGAICNEKLHIVKNGIDVEKFRYNLSLRENIRKEFSWSNYKIIGHIGRLVPVKNQKRIIDIFAEAYNLDNDLRLMIVGDGELKEELRKQIITLGLENVVVLTGTRNDVSAILSAFDVYIMPSFYEGVSISLIEAQASGVQCLVSENAASRETRLTECLVTMKLNEDNSAWAGKILEILKRERDIQAADVIIKKGYDVKDIVSETLNYYRNN